jgi:AraC-like DNA-binding protein
MTEGTILNARPLRQDGREGGGERRPRAAFSLEPSEALSAEGSVDTRPRLQRFSVRGQSGAEPFGTALTDLFGKHLLELGDDPDDFSADIRVCRLNKLKLYRGRYRRGVGIQSLNAASFMQSFPIQGAGRHIINGIEMTSTSRKGILAEPGALRLSFGPDYEHDAIFLDPDALAKTLSGLVGAPQSDQLKLDFSDYQARPEAPAMRRLVKLLTTELYDAESPPSDLVVAELEQAVLVAFLCGNRSNHSRFLEGSARAAAPWQLRRVEEYIEENWDQPISIEALVIVANLSGRSIFHSFKEHRGVSPMKYVKQVRLKHAREMLCNPSSTTNVTNTSYACGFGNLGHFASDYQRVFGEPPSATLNRAREQLRPWPRNETPSVKVESYRPRSSHSIALP